MENEGRSGGGVSATELGGPEVNGDNGVDRRDCLLPAGALISTLIDSEGIRLTEEEVSMLKEITNRCSKLRRFRSHRFGGRLFVTFELDPETNLNRLELELEPA